MGPHNLCAATLITDPHLSFCVTMVRRRADRFGGHLAPRNNPCAALSFVGRLSRGQHFVRPRTLSDQHNRILLAPLLDTHAYMLGSCSSPHSPLLHLLVHIRMCLNKHPSLYLDSHPLAHGHLLHLAGETTVTHVAVAARRTTHVRHSLSRAASGPLSQSRDWLF